jgi:putative transposase
VTKDQEGLRREAVGRYMSGERPEDIRQELGVSARWLYKWIRRYRDGREDWCSSGSRTPRHSPTRTPAWIEDAIERIRHELEKDPREFWGALTIQYRLQEETGVRVGLWSINRILKRRELVRRPEKRFPPKGKAYPVFPAHTGVNVVHQFDLVGPRYLRGSSGRYYFHNLIDAHSRSVAINPEQSKVNTDALDALKSGWGRLGIPDHLQIDNQWPLWGSPRHPRSLGIVLRLCLYLGVEPIFIPIEEPWRNGIIERFHWTFDQKFFRAETFTGQQHLYSRARAFEEFHNTQHRHAPLAGRTPAQVVAGSSVPRRTIPQDFPWPILKQRPSDGTIHLIRFIRSNRVLDIFGERFLVPKDLVYEYVRASILVKEQTIVLTHQDTIVKTYPYNAP